MTRRKRPTVLLTRSAEDNSRISPIFSSYGLDTVSLAGITFADPEDWAPVDNAIRTLESMDGILFTSSKAVEAFLRRLDEVRDDGRDILRTRTIAAVGSRTAESLAGENVHVDIVPESGTAEGLATALETVNVSKKRFLFPKSNIAREILPQELKARNAEVVEIVVYRTVPPNEDVSGPIHSVLMDDTIRYVAFFSPSGVRNVVQAVGAELLAHAVIAVIGPTTADAAHSLGLKPEIMAASPVTEAFAQAIADHFLKTM